MISTSPHHYRQQAASLGITREVVQRAIEQAAAVERQGLPAILTIRHLANLTGADYKYLRSIVARARDGYTPFTIRKRSGGKRLIAAPEPQLLAVQRWIARHVLLKRPVHSTSMAYARGASPMACANRHVGARWLVKLDIHDFFESIPERRVYFAFRECGYQPLVAFELARLCTRVHSPTHPTMPPEWQSSRRDTPGVISSYAHPLIGHLPQGAPTSPMLSNVVSRPLDELLDRLAHRDGLVYTRYSDDVVFSTDRDLGRRQVRTLVKDATRIFAAFGHMVHQKKITVAPPGSRKLVVGLLVDGSEARLSRAYRSRIETHLHGLEKFGLADHAAARRFTSIWGMIRHIEGLISHTCAVDPKHGASLRVRLTEALNKSGWSDRS
jgi:RNA-directed DNA polymerase